MDTEAAILSALHQDPTDETSWLALADWLEETNRPEQAELLRLHRAVRCGMTALRFKTNRKRIRTLLLQGIRPVVPELTNSIGMRLVAIPPGDFEMGSPVGEVGRQETETLHKVEITRPFYLGVFPVTQAEFKSVTRRTPSYFRKNGANGYDVANLDTSRFPVDGVTWHAAVEFCERLSNRKAENAVGRTYRLPTEAEWEYACRGWLGRGAFSLGDTLPSGLVNYNGNNPYPGSHKGPNLERPTPVGEYAPNPFGLYDMHGQVWEWCADWWDDNYYASSPRKDPPGPKSGETRVQRGGCFGAIGAWCRSASRTDDEPDHAQYCFGFRVAMTVQGPTKGRTKVASRL